LLLVAIASALIALVIPQLELLSPSSLQAGQVATQDILAPQDISYESVVLTENQREAAARSVSPIYSPADTGIARRQLERLRNALAFITSVRADAFASPEQKQNDLAALEEIQLSQQTAQGILALNDSRWQVIQQEAIVVLEQVMRNTIREDRLEEARRSASSLVSLSLPEDQAAIVTELVSAFVAPNSFYSEAMTEAAREKARESVNPVTRSYKSGETVVQRGRIITETDLEALQKLGLVRPQFSWQDASGAAIVILLVISFNLLYLRRNTRLRGDVRGLTVATLLFLIFLLGARLIITGHVVLPYVFPLAAFGLTMTALFGAEPAVVSSLSLAILVAFGLPNALELTLYYMLSSILGVLTLGRAQRILAFIWAGAVVASSGSLIAIAHRLPLPETDWVGITTLVGAALLNGIASASLAVLLQFFLAQFMGLTTALQLLEISRPDHPLLQRVLRNAPGTYQHSLQVANLAEQAAERIGADTLLTRVGALYHDVGKALNPVFFIENQLPGSPNPHDQFDPISSASIIIKHVNDGVELARQYRIPRRIQDFIREHHGTMVARFQYVNAVKAAGGDESKVDAELFRYPGPPPASRETAILMLADGSEARVRAERPKDVDEMMVLIKSVIQNRISQGQLDHTDLTLRDLDAIAESFTTTLRGVYHPRIEYPILEKSAPVPATEGVPTIPSAARTTQETALEAEPKAPIPASQSKP
jgi:putative nucleotidyltransferase with HDIG domain